MRDLTRLLEARGTVPIDYADAQRRWDAFRVANGRKGGRAILTAPGENVKFAKTALATVYGLALAAADRSGDYNVCRFATPVCKAACVGDAGMGRYDSVQEARALRTRFLADDPDAAVSVVAKEIAKAVTRNGDVAVRLNTFSDLRWEGIAPWLFEAFPTVAFFDYTKHAERDPAPNYHLTFSASERTTDDEILRTVASGMNVAVVMSPSRNQMLPDTYLGLPVIDGDKSDARFHDRSGAIVGLRAKGTMRTSGAGMVRFIDNPRKIAVA